MNTDDSRTSASGWRRSNPRTGLREIADARGDVLADCPSYEGGPGLEEAQANAELIVSGTHGGTGTPAPWKAVRGAGSNVWLVRGGPREVIVAMVRSSRPDAETVARTIALNSAAARGDARNPSA